MSRQSYTHPGESLGGEYFAVCMTSTACPYTAVADDEEATRTMLLGHNITEHQALDWKTPLRGDR